MQTNIDICTKESRYLIGYFLPYSKIPNFKEIQFRFDNRDSMMVNFKMAIRHV